MADNNIVGADIPWDKEKGLSYEDEELKLKKREPEAKKGSVFMDLAAGYMQSSANLASVPAPILDKLGAKSQAKWLRKTSADAAEFWGDYISDTQKEADKLTLTDPESGKFFSAQNLARLTEDPSQLGRKLGGMVSQAAPTMVAGGTIGKATGLGLKGLGAGISKLAPKTKGLTGKLSRGNQEFLKERLPASVGAATIAGGLGGTDAYNAVMEAPRKNLISTPEFKDLLQEYRESGALEGKTSAEALDLVRVGLAEKAQDGAYGRNFLLGLGTTLLAGGGVERSIFGRNPSVPAPGLKGRLAKIGKEQAKEAIQEGVESGGETLSQNIAEAEFAGSDKPLSSGVKESVAGGIAVGGILGTAGGFKGGRREVSETERSDFDAVIEQIRRVNPELARQTNLNEGQLSIEAEAAGRLLQSIGDEGRRRRVVFVDAPTSTEGIFARNENVIAINTRVNAPLTLVAMEEYFHSTREGTPIERANRQKFIDVIKDAVDKALKDDSNPELIERINKYEERFNKEYEAERAMLDRDGQVELFWEEFGASVAAELMNDPRFLKTTATERSQEMRRFLSTVSSILSDADVKIPKKLKSKLASPLLRASELPDVYKALEDVLLASTQGQPTREGGPSEEAPVPDTEGSPLADESFSEAALGDPALLAQEIYDIEDGRYASDLDDRNADLPNEIIDAYSTGGYVGAYDRAKEIRDAKQEELNASTDEDVRADLEEDINLINQIIVRIPKDLSLVPSGETTTETVEPTPTPVEPEPIELVPTPTEAPAEFTATHTVDGEEVQVLEYNEDGSVGGQDGATLVRFPDGSKGTVESNLLLPVEFESFEESTPVYPLTDPELEDTLTDIRDEFGGEPGDADLGDEGGAGVPLEPSPVEPPVAGGAESELPLPFPPNPFTEAEGTDLVSSEEGAVDTEDTTRDEVSRSTLEQRAALRRDRKKRANQQVKGNVTEDVLALTKKSVIADAKVDEASKIDDTAYALRGKTAAATRARKAARKAFQDANPEMTEGEVAQQFINLVGREQARYALEEEGISYSELEVFGIPVSEETQKRNDLQDEIAEGNRIRIRGQREKSAETEVKGNVTAEVLELTKKVVLAEIQNTGLFASAGTKATLTKAYKRGLEAFREANPEMSDSDVRTNFSRLVQREDARLTLGRETGPQAETNQQVFERKADEAKAALLSEGFYTEAELSGMSDERALSEARRNLEGYDLDYWFEENPEIGVLPEPGATEVENIASRLGAPGSPLTIPTPVPGREGSFGQISGKGETESEGQTPAATTTALTTITEADLKEAADIMMSAMGRGSDSKASAEAIDNTNLPPEVKTKAKRQVDNKDSNPNRQVPEPNTLLSNIEQTPVRSLYDKTYNEILNEVPAEKLDPEGKTVISASVQRLRKNHGRGRVKAMDEVINSLQEDGFDDVAAKLSVHRDAYDSAPKNSEQRNNHFRDYLNTLVNLTQDDFVGTGKVLAKAKKLRSKSAEEEAQAKKRGEEQDAASKYVRPKWSSQETEKAVQKLELRTLLQGKDDQKQKGSGKKAGIVNAIARQKAAKIGGVDQDYYAQELEAYLTYEFMRQKKDGGSMLQDVAREMDSLLSGKKLFYDRTTGKRNIDRASLTDAEAMEMAVLEGETILWDALEKRAINFFDKKKRKNGILTKQIADQAKPTKTAFDPLLEVDIQLRRLRMEDNALHKDRGVGVEKRRENVRAEIKKLEELRKEIKEGTRVVITEAVSEADISAEQGATVEFADVTDEASTFGESKSTADEVFSKITENSKSKNFSFSSSPDQAIAVDRAREVLGLADAIGAIEIDESGDPRGPINTTVYEGPSAYVEAQDKLLDKDLTLEELDSIRKRTKRHLHEAARRVAFDILIEENPDKYGDIGLTLGERKAALANDNSLRSFHNELEYKLINDAMTLYNQLRAARGYDSDLGPILYSRNKYGSSNRLTMWMDDNKLMGALRTRYYDYMLPVKNLARDLVERGYILPPSSDVERHIKVTPGMTKTAIMEIDRKYFRDIKRILRKHRINTDEFDEFLIARHGPTRNKVLLKTKKRDDGSGYSDDQLAKLKLKYAGDSRLDAFERAADLMSDMLSTQLDMMVEYGLINAKTRSLWRRKWGPTYIPLKDSDAREIIAEAQGRGPDNPAFSPTANAFAQIQWTAIRGIQNREINMALLDLVRNNEGPWKEITKEVSVVDPATGLETVLPNTEFERNADHVFRVMENGTPVYISFTGTEGTQIARALKGSDLGTSMAIVKQMGKWTRFYGGMLTSFNFAFTVPNLTRDTGMAIGTLTAEGHADIAKHLLNPSELLRNHRAIRRYLKKPDSTFLTPELQLVADFFRDGGSVEQFGVGNPIEIYEHLNRDISEFTGTKLVREFFGLIEAENKVMENMVRFSTYKHALAKGMTRLEAAALAKDVTVDFDQKGINSSALGSFYLFFNANVQGNARLIKAVLGGKNGRRVMMSCVALGYAMDKMNRTLAEDDDNDGQNDYDEIEEHFKRNNLILMRPGGKRNQIPMPYGFNIFVDIGRNLSLLEEGKVTPGQMMVSVINATVNVMNPLGSGGDIEEVKETFVKTLSPTLTDPAVELTVNRDWIGNPITPENRYNELTWNKSQEFRERSTSKLSIKAAAVLNSWGGGDEVAPATGFGSTLNTYPDSLDYIYDFVTAGVVKFFERTGKFVNNMANTGLGEMKRNDIPIYRRFFAENEDYRDRYRFIKASENVMFVKQIYDKYEKAGDRRKAKDWLEKGNNKTLYKLAGKFERHNKKLKSLYKEYKTTRPERRDRLEERMMEQYKAGLRDYFGEDLELKQSFKGKPRK